MSGCPKVVRDGRVAVLYSPGYGAGWFSWNSAHPACLFDPDIVAMVEEGAAPDDIEVRAMCKWADAEGCGFYAEGARGLAIEWLPVGAQFRIHEHDGSESIETRDGLEWVTA